MSHLFPVRTITMTLRLPREVYEAWQQRGGAQAALDAQGLWPEQVQSFKWTIDPVGPFYVLDAVVAVDLFED